MSDHYSGVFIIDSTDGMVLAVSDSHHPTELKMGGGMAVNGETPEETARREGSEELRTQVLAATLVLKETVPGRNGNHVRYFFLADKVVGALEKGATWEVEEKSPDGRVVEKLTAKWVPIAEFADRLFYKQHPAFGAVLAKLGQNPDFYQKYAQLLDRFPEPENLGL